MQTFAVQLTCCGRDDGIAGPYDTWEEADALREGYLTNVGGHERSAIIIDGSGWTSQRREPRYPML